MTDHAILNALGMFSSWHGETSPLGTTGDYATDMQLADAFRALLYRPALADRLDWIEREVSKPKRRPTDDLYHAEIISWWLSIWEAEKFPIILDRDYQRKAAQCVLS